MDMVGWREAGDPVLQVSPGDGPDSSAMAALARDVATAGGMLEPVVRPLFDPESYLYNTDGIVFRNMGFPVILLNEHLNRLHNLRRDGYHDSTDTVARIDWSYATAVARVAIELVAQLADARP